MEDIVKALDILARTIYGEARGESFNGKVAVAYTITNRASRPSWWGSDITSVCLKPQQYSCWNPDDPNFNLLGEATLASHSFRDCLAAALLVYNRTLPDPTNGATHYFALSMSTPPLWAAKMKAVSAIGNHSFFVDPPTVGSVIKPLKV
jgi:N-acetylmuramoyl-L-alanine amidase